MSIVLNASDLPLWMDCERRAYHRRFEPLDENAALPEQIALKKLVLGCLREEVREAGHFGRATETANIHAYAACEIMKTLAKQRVQLRNCSSYDQLWRMAAQIANGASDKLASTFMLDRKWEIKQKCEWRTGHTAPELKVSCKPDLTGWIGNTNVVVHMTGRSGYLGILPQLGSYYLAQDSRFVNAVYVLDYGKKQVELREFHAQAAMRSAQQSARRAWLALAGSDPERFTVANTACTACSYCDYFGTGKCIETQDEVRNETDS